MNDESLKLTTISNATFEREFFSGYHVVPSFDMCKFVECKFREVFFEGTPMDECIYLGCHFEQAVFYWTTHFCSTFEDCEFSDIVFGGVTFDEMKFVNCKFNKTIFRPSNLGGGCEFSDDVFSNCEFVNCVSINSIVEATDYLPRNVKRVETPIQELGLITTDFFK